MKKEELLKSDYLKQFSSVEELNDFVSQIHKRGLEQLLEGELDAHLGFDKHQKSELSNYRNGHTTKRIKTTLGESIIQVPRDRDATFNPMIIPDVDKPQPNRENI